MLHLGPLLPLPDQLLNSKPDQPQQQRTLLQMLDLLPLLPPLLLQQQLQPKAKVPVFLVRWQAPQRKLPSPKSKPPKDLSCHCHQRTDKLCRGVAVGSSIGHAIGGLFGGGSSAAAPVEQQPSAAVATQNQEQAQNNWGPRSCETDARSFTKCLDENQGNMQICGWYLEQLVSRPLH